MERLDAGDRLFVTNLTDCPYMDSSGLGDVVASWKRVKSRDGDDVTAGVTRAPDADPIRIDTGLALKV